VSVEQQDLPPFMVVLKLTEGYVLQYGGGYTVALTSPADLSTRVKDVAEQSEVGFQSAVTPPMDPRTGVPISTPPSPELIEATAVPAAVPQTMPKGVVPTQNLEMEWANVRRMIAWMAVGFNENGLAFGRKEFDAALPMFAPHVDPKEAEYELSEFLAELHED
jgi:hypothetical protein